MVTLLGSSFGRNFSCACNREEKELYRFGCSSNAKNGDIHRWGGAIVLSLLVPMDRYTDFLNFIGNIFAPLYAVIFADVLLLHFKKQTAQLKRGENSDCLLCLGWRCRSLHGIFIPKCNSRLDHPCHGCRLIQLHSISARSSDVESFPDISGIVGRVRLATPLILEVTNYVTMNDCANATLAIGASPVMSKATADASQLAKYADAVVLNMGMTDAAQVRAMLSAAKSAHDHHVPVVFDPVGAGATQYRQELAEMLLQATKPRIIKGNWAEIAYLGSFSATQNGVDSLENAQDLEKAVQAAVRTARRYNAIVLSTGAIDVASDGTGAWTIGGGVPELGKVCGSGCMLSAVAAAFMAETGSVNALRAALAASLSFKYCAEKAASIGAAEKGLTSFRWAFMDALSIFDDAALDRHIASSLKKIGWINAQQ